MQDITADIVTLLRQIFGASAGIIGMVIVFGLLKGILDFAGDPGKKLASWRGQGLRDRAQALGDTIGQNREARALNPSQNKWKRRLSKALRPGATGRMNRELRGQEAQSALDAAKGAAGITNDDAKAYLQSISENKAAASVLANAQNMKLANAIADGSSSLSDKLGVSAGDDDVHKALGAVETRAIAEAIKDVELQADFPPGALDKVGQEMVAAIKRGDSVSARAYQNILLNSGSKGSDQYRQSMNGVMPADMKGDTEDALKRNILTSHPKIKETAADIMAHATSASGTTMQQVSGTASTWSMSNEDLVKQKSHSLLQADVAGGISQKQAREIKADDQLYRKLDDKGRGIIDRLAT